MLPQHRVHRASKGHLYRITYAIGLFSRQAGVKFFGVEIVMKNLVPKGAEFLPGTFGNGVAKTRWSRMSDHRKDTHVASIETEREWPQQQSHKSRSARALVQIDCSKPPSAAMAWPVM